ncbi:MAG: hypothetical protein CMN76_15215 [Spirochaetaceae bacterium]|nr:hypothetical protein [Spirochaetaceae bacterium]|tara:strand:+ start:13839 stop:14297 length:459 start_codon:yes stop_codon:yes gene_type:complete
MIELKSIILPVYALWCFLLLFFLFRRGPGALWKGCAFLIFAFYGIYHYNELIQSYQAFVDQFNKTTVSMVIQIFRSFGSVLFLLWPVMLWVSYYASSDELSKTVIRWMVLLTLFFWVFYFLFEFYPPVDRSTVEGWLPDRFSMPSIPSPPTE